MKNIKEALEKNGKYWIVFVGDSITSAEWVHPNWREIVEYVLKEELQRVMADWKMPSWGIRCFNFGFDGSTTKDILERIEEIKTVKPDMVIGLMGGNDPVLGVSVEDSVNNIRQIVEEIGTNVAWCNSTSGMGEKKNLRYRPYAKAFTEMEDTNNLQKIDMFSIYQSFPVERFFTFKSGYDIEVEGIKIGDPDPMHPNQLGNAYIAKVILKEVWDIDFDPEKYMADVNKGVMIPKY